MEHTDTEDYVTKVLSKWFSNPETVFDNDISDEEAESMQDYLETLIGQSAVYYKGLEDKKDNSRSEISRMIAKRLLEEERWSANPLFLKCGFPETGNVEEIREEDLDLQALHVEYLTDRARQAMRDAEMGALYLKIIVHKRNR